MAHPEIDYRFVTEVDGPIDIACDRHQFGQAMTNVLKNAGEAVDARQAASEPDFRGQVAVIVSADDTWLDIAVEDNGIGLPQESESLLEPYVTTREKGTGLGLAIVNKIVEEHGGVMSFARAEHGDTGTRVSMRFARHPEMAGQEAAE